VPGTLTLHDISSGGRLLMTRDTNRYEVLGFSPGEPKERDLSWIDWSLATDISSDGKTLLFSEAGEGGGAGYSVYVRGTDGSPAVRLGQGAAGGLSPDGKWVFSVINPASGQQLILLPTGAGEERRLPTEGLNLQYFPDWLPDSRHVLFTANEAGHGSRIYLLDIEGGRPRALTPEGYLSYRRVVSPDGRFCVLRGPDQRIYLYPLEGGEPTPIPGLSSLDIPTRWAADSRSIYVYRRGQVPAKVYRVEISTGRKELWRELIPADSSGVMDIPTVIPTPDGGSYAYSYGRILSDLFVVEGVK
jgi:Tol biopolymer transport system component